MYPRFAFALLFSVCAFGLGIAIPAFPEQKCGANAVFLTCGSACVPDCANPEPPKFCTLQCVMDCFCKEGFLKNAKGECVRPQECEARTQETASELEIPQCPNNEEFQACGSACAPTCANPHPSPVCTKNCVIGCFCKPGFLRTKLGLCVPANKCEAPETSLDLEVPQCPNNEEFQACGSACAPTCANPHPSPVCTKNCVIGCFCKPGYLRTKLGLCVPANQCEAPQTAAFFAYPPEISQCKENEVFMPCGSACAPTCANPHPGPVCTMQCVVGCFCKPGYLKNEHGVCVPSETCGVPAAEAMPMPPQMCGENEEFRQCKGCDGTCDNPNPICPRICIQGCACKEGHFRNGPNGKCVLAQQCPPMPAVAVMPLPPQVCGENEEFRQCKGCDGTCANPNPLCPRICIPGCACKQGHLRSGPNGKCIMAQQCPQVDPVPATSFMMLPPVPQCGANEVFRSCGTACPATCANPHPSPVCTKNCVIGCFCKEGFLKNAQGVCVPAANCEAPQAIMASAVQPAGQCSSDREIFSDCGEQLDCLASCNTPLPFLIHGEPQLPKKCLERKCTPGCVCQKPYVRHADGRCVEVNECQHDSPFTTPSH